MMSVLDHSEVARLAIQERLDSETATSERNRLGQYATPTALATEMLECARTLLPKRTQVRFLDPAFGTGSFYSALLRVFPSSRIRSAAGFELDPRCGLEAAELWRDMPLQLTVADFTHMRPPSSEEQRADLVICNPPYVRHHHLPASEKIRLRKAAEMTAGVRLSGLAGLYCYFLCLSHAWMTSGGLAGWLVPSEFMDVNYGRQLKAYLLERVTLLRIHRFAPDDVQFDDALVSSAAVWFRKESPPADNEVEFTYGGSLTKPSASKLVPASALREATKWTGFPARLVHRRTPGHQLRLSDLFTVKRGVATGANDFFILSPEEARSRDIPDRFLVPILPGPKHLPTEEIRADSTGEPILTSKFYLLTCNLSEAELKAKHPSLWKYILSGVERGINKRYLCRMRSPWYSQERRLAAPLLCTYMGRQRGEDGKPFRFILNHSKAVAANVYLMLYPKQNLEKASERMPDVMKAVWRFLNTLPPRELMNEGRVYGGGLYKLEPRELGNVVINFDGGGIELTAKSVSSNRQLILFPGGSLSDDPSDAHAEG